MLYLWLYIIYIWNYVYYSCLERRQWQPTPVLLPGKSHGWRSLVSCSPWGCWESDTTERLHFHFSLSCIEERNGNPLQCSCLEDPRDGGAWWAAVYGVAQSWTQLKWLSSSSSSSRQTLSLWLCLWSPFSSQSYINVKPYFLIESLWFFPWVFNYFKHLTFIWFWSNA